MPDPREFDIVLFGATGFVGRLTAADLAEGEPSGARIALAGRSRERLTAVRDGLGPAAADWELLVADASDATAMAGLARRTKVVLTTVGPYAKYGRTLVAACADAGTHYADLTGEILFHRDVVDAHQARASQTGARIVPSCGFDSIPSDLGVFELARQVAADGEGELTTTTTYVRSLKGGISGGTIDSMREQARAQRSVPGATRIVNDSYGLSPNRSAEPPSRDRVAGPSGPLATIARAVPVRRDGQGRWTAPFLMASYNTRVVRRSNALLDYRYGRGFRYAEVTDCGRDLTAPVKAGVLTGGLLGLATGMSFGPTRAVLDRILPKPGEGPSVESQEAGRFVFDIETTTTTGAEYRCRFAADKDPGYSGTAVMLGEAGLCLAYDELPEAAGVLTPATAMGEALADRLRARGFTIEVTRR
jgi:short subunit dehydrogenase-like uncharacterized protein